MYNFNFVQQLTPSRMTKSLQTSRQEQTRIDKKGQDYQQQHELIVNTLCASVKCIDMENLSIAFEVFMTVCIMYWTKITNKCFWSVKKSMKKKIKKSG